MDPGKTTVYVLRVDTARRCFFCLGCMFGQRNDFFWAGGGAGRAKNSQFFQRHVFQFWLHVCSCETRSIERNMRSFVGRGSRWRWQRDFDPTIHRLIATWSQIYISFVRFSSRPENSRKMMQTNIFAPENIWLEHGWNPAFFWTEMHPKPGILQSFKKTAWMHHAIQNLCIWRCSLHVSWTLWFCCRWNFREAVFDGQNPARLTGSGPRNL